MDTSPAKTTFLQVMNFRESLVKIADVIGKYSQDDDLRQFTVSLLGDFTKSSGDYSHAERIFTWVQSNIKFVNDIEGVETLQTSRVTLKNGFGDCDCLTILLGSMYRCIGYQFGLIVVQLAGAGDYNHIFGTVKVLKPYESAGFYYVDATNKNEGFGWTVSPELYTKRYCMFLGGKEDFT